MSNVIVDKQKIDLLANAIADKSGVPVTMTLDEMREAVDGIDTGGIVPTGTIDITHVGMTDVTDYATAHVYNADANVGAWSTSYITENGLRKWRVSYEAYAESAGWVNEGPIGSSREYKMGAVPKNTSVTPTESAQTIGGANYMMEGAVTVNAIPSSYVGSGVTRRSSSDMTASGATVTAPAGYYSSAASKTIPDADYFNGNEYEFFTDGDAYKWRTRGFSEVDSDEGDTPGYIADKTRHNGEWVEFNAIPANTSVTPTESSQTIGGGRTMMAGAVTVNAIPPNYVGSGITQRSSSDLTASGATVTVPSGYYSSQATKSVTNGTAGTPTATKGTVSNHAVAVTPSVTNSAGYITGGTKTGTAVSVSASELVSGTLEINSSGTKDVTNYASAYVPQMTLPSAPSSSHTGTVSSSISWASSIRYLNVPAGYNDTARYYTLEGVPLDPITITENGTYNALDYEAAGFSSVVVNVQGGGTSGVQFASSATIRTSASEISFHDLYGKPIAFHAMIDGNDVGTSATATVVAFVYDGQTLHAQTINNQVTYDSSSFSYTYNNGTLTITSTGATIPDINFVLTYAYGGSSANIDTKDVQVGSGATSITFTGLADEPVMWSCIFKSNFSTSSGYQRVVYVESEDGDFFGVSMDSSAHCATDWTASYSNGSLTISSTSASVGGYFHQPGYYQLTAIYGEPVETTIEPLTVTENGTYSESGVAYSPVVVNVPTGGGVNVATTTWTNSDSTATSHTFTGLLGTPKAAFLRCTSSLSRSSSSSNYFIADMRWTGSATAGNSFRRSNGTYANVTSGYSFSANGTSLTVSTSGTSTSNPGSFYNGTYELVYIY